MKNLLKRLFKGKQKSYATIEEAINDLLEGEHKETALKFMAYLNENQLTPKMPDRNHGFHYGKIPYNGYYLGWIVVEPNKWMFQIFNFSHLGEFYDDDEEFTAAVFEHIHPCSASCGCCPSGEPCQLSKETMIFGKKFCNVCFQHTRDFVNPDEKTLGYIKKLIEYGKMTVPHKEIYHCNHL